MKVLLRTVMDLMTQLPLLPRGCSQRSLYPGNGQGWAASALRAAGWNVTSAPWVRLQETERPGVTRAAQPLGNLHGCGIFAQCLRRDSGDRKWTCWQHQKERTWHTVLLPEAPCTRGNEALSLPIPVPTCGSILWDVVWPASLRWSLPRMDLMAQDSVSA